LEIVVEKKTFSRGAVILIWYKLKILYFCPFPHSPAISDTQNSEIKSR
jgi:hypothetical protein